MKIATRIARYQLIIAVSCAVLWGVFGGGREGLAALAGGGIGAVLTFYAGLKTFSASGKDAQHAVMNFYRAEVRKIILAAVLFAVAVRVFGDVFAPVLVTFMLTLPVYWFALLWDSSDG
ncbi:MAG: ATP synthase subunit I [Solimonas sp.]